MSHHVNNSASPASRRLRAMQLELCPSILGDLYTGAYWAPGMNTIGCFFTRSPTSKTVIRDCIKTVTTSTRSLEVIKPTTNEPEPAKATASLLAAGSFYQSSFELATIGY